METDKVLSNTRVIIQSANDSNLSRLVNTIREKHKDSILYATEIRQNTRPPFEGGVHCIIYLALGVSSSE